MFQYLYIISIFLIILLIFIYEFKRYSKVKPIDGVRTKIISVPINEWLSNGGKLFVFFKHIVKCSDGSVMLPDISQEKYTIGEIRFEKAYEINGVVKGRPISTGIIFKLFGTFWALLNMSRKKKIKMTKKELPTNMYIELLNDEGNSFWLTLGNSTEKDYNEIYMYFK